MSEKEIKKAKEEEEEDEEKEQEKENKRATQLLFKQMPWSASIQELTIEVHTGDAAAASIQRTLCW